MTTETTVPQCSVTEVGVSRQQLISDMSQHILSYLQVNSISVSMDCFS